MADAESQGRAIGHAFRAVELFEMGEVSRGLQLLDLCIIWSMHERKAPWIELRANAWLAARLAAKRLEERAA